MGVGMYKEKSVSEKCCDDRSVALESAMSFPHPSKVPRQHGAPSRELLARRFGVRG